MQGKVDICGISTSQLRVLSQEETDSLLRRSRQGDEGARQMLIEGNLRLVLSVIQRFDKRDEGHRQFRLGKMRSLQHLRRPDDRR